MRFGSKKTVTPGRAGIAIIARSTLATITLVAACAGSGLPRALSQDGQQQATQHSTELQRSVLDATYDLSPRLPPTNARYYLFESSNQMPYISSGQAEPPKQYRFFLAMQPKLSDEKGLYRCHIKSYYLTIADDKPVKVDGLSSYDYSFAPGDSGYDDKGQLFGISHDDFSRARLDGKALHKMQAFALYMGLIDFHTFEALIGDPNVRQLTRVGQRARLTSDGRDLPVDLADVVLKGSIQTMGRSLVEAKGLRMQHDKLCVLFHYSVESSVSLLMEPVPGAKIKMTGPSCFQGTITAEVDTGLVTAADFTEHVIGTNYLGALKLHDFVTRRDGSLKRISKEQYEREEVTGN